MLKTRKPTQAGFTIVELMIATAVFSVILLIVTAGVISFTNRYYKGIVSTNTQNTTRSVLNELTQAIQFSAGGVTPDLGTNGSTRAVCINNRPYYYVLGRQLGSDAGSDFSKHVLVTEDAPCSTGAIPDVSTLNSLGSLQNGRELLGEHMRLSQFSVAAGSETQPASVQLQVVYGDADLFCRTTIASGSPGSCTTFTGLNTTQLRDGNGALQCRSGAGSQYCAVSSLSANVTSRL